MDEKLIEQSPLAEKKVENSGSWLWKNLKPFGCILCLVCLAAFLFFCLSSGPEKIEGYEPAQTQQYYLDHPEELAQEIKTNIQPHLEALEGCYVQDGRVVLEINSDEFIGTRAVILQYFDEGNIEFISIN